MDNANDRRSKGRFGLIGKNGFKTAKITFEIAQQIKAEYAQGGTFQRVLGEKYGISQTNVGRIIRGVMWNKRPEDFVPIR